jgi:hypothetical protein
MGQRVRPLVLTVIDTAGIQDYIFNSNSLQHSVGASYLVEWATAGAVFTALNELEGSPATNVDQFGVIDPHRRIGENGVTSEIIYSGGGNAVVLFSTMLQAQTFAGQLTRQVLVRAPGLQLVVVHQELGTGIGLSDAVQVALCRLADKKLNRRHSTPLLGLGVTAACAYTGLPAVVEDADDGRPLSSEILAKVHAFSPAENRLTDAVRDLLRSSHTRFLRNFDDLGTKGESSYMAVVHIDGNGMGKRVKQIAVQNRDDDDAYISAMRRFAARVQKISLDALRDAVRLLQDAMLPFEDNGRSEERIGGVVTVRDDRLPFRPIVYGGDDVTFVCDGRLGLTLAEFYLRRMEQSLALEDNPAHAASDASQDKLYLRAGVAVVKSHYPFSRAYELAENLAGSAKQFIKEQIALGDLPGASAIDWHFAVNGLVLEIDDLRRRDYQIVDHKIAVDLQMRPLLLEEDGPLPTWRTWRTFTAIVSSLKDENGPWAQSGNKIKALRAELRAGPQAVRHYMSLYMPGVKLYAIPGYPDSADSGWIAGERSTHFDAVEALEFFVPIETAIHERGGR